MSLLRIPPARVAGMLILALTLFGSVACAPPGPQDEGLGGSWAETKAAARPVVALSEEFGTPCPQPLAGLGWEDGIHVSRDGLNLYCVYVPADLFSFILKQDRFEKLPLYKRGPAFGMDLKTNPAGGRFEWLHGDILYAHRTTTADPFPTWQLSGLARSVYSEGAPCPVFQDAETIDLMAFTSNDSPGNNTDIWMIEKTGKNPSGRGAPLPEPVRSRFNEDNPHLERLTPHDLVLLFDSDNRPGGKGSHDIWFSTSNDRGKTWTEPRNVVSVNTPEQDHQPHLYCDRTGQWFLYFSAHHNDGKLAIFRMRQRTPGDWDSWTDRQLVVAAGNTAGVGEPTLTARGDLSFVVVLKNPRGTAHNLYDADPWFLPARTKP